VSAFIWPAYGFGLPNTVMDRHAYNLLELLRPDSVKAIATNYPRTPDGAAVLHGELRRVRSIRPNVAVYVRLPDSFVGGARVKGLGEYVDECSWYIDEYLGAGVNAMQVGNEDNNPECAWMGGGFADPPADNQYFYLETFARLRQRFGRDVRLGSSPVMHSYRSGYVKWYNGRRALLNEADFNCANVYFESSAAITHPDYGASWKWIAERSPKPVVIAEYGVPPLALEPPPVRDERLQRLIPAWWASLLAQGQVEAAHLFLLAGRWGWEAWSPSPAVCRAWATWRSRLELTLKGQVAA
jgi:hypothetical protein